MSSVTIETGKSPASDTQSRRSESKAKPLAKRGKSANKAKPAKKVIGKPAAPTNKKAEVIALMKRAKGATQTEIMKATGWQKHTVRGFVSILGSKGGETIESSKSETGDRTYRIAK